MRIRSIINAELIGIDPNTNEEKLMQIGAHTYLEATKVEVFELEGETLANIYLLDGWLLEGVLWGQQYFENHGVPEERINVSRNTRDYEITHFDRSETDEGTEQSSDLQQHNEWSESENESS